jgi:alpha-L-fucosidase
VPKKFIFFEIPIPKRTLKTIIMRNQILFRFCWLALGLTVLIRGPVAQAADAQWQDPAWQQKVWDARGCNADDSRFKWFRDAKFGAFIHFGVYSQLGGYWHGKGPYDPAEQIMGLGEHRQAIPLAEYRAEAAGEFNPTNFNARGWVQLIKAAGQKYVILTTKHHDGFCMFQTATTSNNVVQATPFGRDVVRELADECKRQGIVFCPYYSIGDWSAADVMARRFTSYPDYMRAQLKELLSNYGDIKMLWFDNYWYVNGQWHNDETHAKELYAYVRSLSPNTLIDDRCGRGASSTDGDYTTPENQLKGSQQSRYFEVVMTDTTDDNWGWVRGATNYRKPAQLIRNLIDCTSKGGNFVLNVGPTASGEFPAEHRAILQEMGKWTGTNGEAIYGTEPAPECEFDKESGAECYATKTRDHIYVEVIRWPDGGKPVTVTIHGNGFKGAELLDHSLPEVRISAENQNGTTVLSMPKPSQVDPYATVFKLSFANETSP